MTDAPRFSFHPLERRGLLIGLSGGQLAAIGGGSVTALFLHAAIAGPTGVVAGVVIWMGITVASLWVRNGHPVGWWGVLAAGWTLRRGRRLDDRPTEGALLSGSRTDVRRRPHDGRRSRSGHEPSRRRSRHGGRGRRPGLPGVSIGSVPGAPGEPDIGVVTDRRAGTCSAIVAVDGCSFSLLDPDGQAQRMESWRRVLGTLARPGGAVTRIQWVQGSTSEALPVPTTGEGDMGDRYRRLIESAGRDLWFHRTWVVISVGGRRPGPASVSSLRRELRLLEGQLRAAELCPGPPLDVEAVAGLIDGDAGGSPLATDDKWSCHRVDGGWHATYWISEWPRLEVGPDFLSPVLVGSFRSRLAVVMAPVPIDRAMREVRSARTADLADAELRARAGFLPSVRRDRESEGVTRREEELAAGHHEYRFSGYLTVSADDREGLTRVCAEAEHAAQSAHLEIRRLYGRQAEAYTWTLPLGRGLR
ncbi:MAG TPA: SCO6880 family protein [Acidimicrobiales bacterium]|jgi:hypothetical protein|nr:SCO6880 family protein [Acidimicrobiales bacterium]